MRAGGNLWQMRDGEDLVAAGHAAHGLADLQPDASADAGVDLVEDERGHARQTREDGLQRQHDTRQLAARGDARQRTRLVSHVE